MAETLAAELGRARVLLGPGARVTAGETDGLWSVRMSLGPPRHGHTPQWGVAAYDKAHVTARIGEGVAELTSDRELLKARGPLTAPVTGPALLTPTAAGVLVHECFGHTSEADNYLAHGGALNRGVGDLWTRAPLTVRDRPGAHPYAGSYTRDDEGTDARTVTLLADGRWAGLLTDRATRWLSGGHSTGHGRGGGGAIAPRCSVLEVRPGSHPPSALLGGLGDGWLLGTAIGGFSVREHAIIELLWARRVRAGRLTDEVIGPAAICARKTALAARITALGDDVSVLSSPYTCVKGGHEVGSTLISPSMLLERCVLRPLKDVRRLVSRAHPGADRAAR
ncbi:hypothetical protein GCM10010387_37240 [Streptomyces inusitatus]|uniref:Metalloprotease TldD/E C-terminal domain-containing protein n=1 Tax=Streptomyces inusitatus TaxID=68221 RepID=A0A918UWW0_9ACTN|nr:metallopeptidase TldD-related protein [Streptomyces inusitatus]GGZ39531.1 hypothetical protein GCM10010387_37240 [Streptomyces inusitatus]